MMDMIYLKYGVKMAHIETAKKEHGLDNDEDVKAVHAANMASREQLLNKSREEAKAQLKLTDD